MSSFTFDPEAYKVANTFGGYDPNEKGLFQYPRKSLYPSTFEGAKGDGSQPGSPYKLNFVDTIRPDEVINTRLIDNVRNVFQDPILDPATSHYKIFTQDPALLGPKSNQVKTFGPVQVPVAASINDGNSVDSSTESEEHEKKEAEIQGVSPCGIRRLTTGSNSRETGRMRKPIDPIHWKPDLFDTPYEKYYLKNLLIEDPYREFLTSYSEATLPPHYCSEYRQSYSGNPTLSTSSSGRILGLSRPTDISEPCYWKRYKTQKFRDVIFTHEKDSIDSHLDYNDPKRYNPWPRLKMSYDQMLEGNYRPRPRSGVEYSVTTLLPAVSPYSKQWII